jgi:hypothetical protein
MHQFPAMLADAENVRLSPSAQMCRSLEIGAFCRSDVHLNSIAAARETRPESV